MSCKLSDKCDNVFACNILRPEVELLGCSFYKPKKPMTNEEWRRTCSVEDFADFLADACAWAIEEQRCYKHTEKSTAMFWKQWLKDKYQPCNTL